MIVWRIKEKQSQAMYGSSLERRFKKAQTLQPFSSNQQQQQQEEVVSKDDNKVQVQVGGGESRWQPPDWSIEPRPGVFSLHVFKDGQLLDRINLDKRRHIFGRQFHTCDFVLDHQSVSRQHAAVVPHKNGSIYVIDLGSAHGTFVANERLTKDSPVELEVGQSLRFAASTRLYILKKEDHPSSPPTTINLPPPPDPSDEEAVLAYNTFLNRHSHHVSSCEPPVKRRKTTTRVVSFRDQVGGGELVQVVGVSDGADVETHPGPIPIGVKEGTSLVGKYESLVQTTIIPRGKKMESPKEGGGGGVTDKLQQVLNRVKAATSSSSKAGIYDGIYGTTTKVASSWAYSGGRDSPPPPPPAPAVRQESDSDDDLFG